MKKQTLYLLRILLGSTALYASSLLATTEPKKSETHAQLELPLDLPEIVNENQVISIPAKDGQLIPTTIDNRLQKGLQDFLKQQNSPIAAVVVVEVKTGHILALVQGRDPKKWGSPVHTALYPGFPAASIFKLVPTTAALEVVHIDPTNRLSPPDKCSTVNPHGLWLDKFAPGNSNYEGMSLERAFAFSCNSFFAKLAVQYVGMGLISKYAEKFGWGITIPADFLVPRSPIDLPAAASSNIQTVGRFAAGFGRVGMSPIHAAWFNLTIANKGQTQQLRISADNNLINLGPFQTQTMMDEETSLKIRRISHQTVQYGTARAAFHRKRFRLIAPYVGGKTGTLNSQELKAQITWFTGSMPFENPEVIVSSVVALENGRWRIRGADLAAEALFQWSQRNNFQSAKNPLETTRKSRTKRYKYASKRK